MSYLGLLVFQLHLCSRFRNGQILTTQRLEDLSDLLAESILLLTCSAPF